VSEMYKIIAKVLANRLRRVVEKIILKPQNVFVKVSTVANLNCVHMANECLGDMIKSREP
jgi:hypothetical protein